MAGNQGKKLESWKEIADYIHRDERTAMRWGERGMPIHRVPGGKRGHVFAHAHEIDTWLEGLPTHIDLDHGEKAAGVEPASPEKAAARRDRLSAWGWGLTSVLLLGMLGVLSWRIWHAVQRTPASFEVKGNKLIVYDKSRQPFWEHAFDFPLNEAQYHPSRNFPPELTVAIEDIDQDGKPELLFVPLPPGTPEYLSRKSLLCFDSQGRLRWQYKPTRTMRYGDKSYEPPYTVSFFRVMSPANGRLRHVWAVANHLPWFPSVVAKLAADGHVLAEYWHPGYINVLAEATLAGRRVLLVGAINNETIGAGLSVLDYDHPQGSAPASSEAYRCQNCPPGSPLAYLVFPSSAFARAVSSRPSVTEIRVRQTEDLEVTVGEGKTASGAGANISYALGPDLRLRSVEVTDDYVAAYTDLQSSGSLKGPLNRNREVETLKGIHYWNGHKFTTEWFPLRASQ